VPDDPGRAGRPHRRAGRRAARARLAAGGRGRLPRRRAAAARLDELLSEDEDPEADDAERRLLEALGAVPPGTDLTQLRRDLLDEQVAGFYSPETGELVVRVPDDGRIRPIDRITVAHELEHALADQTIGLPELDGFDDDADAALAALAVVEGDATLLMNLWALEHVSVTDQLGAALGGDLAAAQASLAAVPPYLQRELLFPYTDGLELICDRYLEGGWEAVDAAYADLPTTTAEVLFGDDANPPARRRRCPPPPASRRSTWRPSVPRRCRGCSRRPGGDEDRALDRPRERAAVWAGGQAWVWADGDGPRPGWRWSTAGDVAPPLCGSVEDWYAAAFPAARREQAEGATVRARAADRGALRGRRRPPRDGPRPRHRHPHGRGREPLTAAGTCPALPLRRRRPTVPPRDERTRILVTRGCTRSTAQWKVLTGRLAGGRVRLPGVVVRR
jgi:hypothetical protein